MELGRIMVGLEQGDVEDGMETGEVSREMELVSGIRDGAIDWERAEATVVELVRWTGGLDVATEEPDKVARLETRAIGDTLVVIASLNVLGVLELSTQLSVKTLETSREV